MCKSFNDVPQLREDENIDKMTLQKTCYTQRPRKVGERRRRVGEENLCAASVPAQLYMKPWIKPFI